MTTTRSTRLEDGLAEYDAQRRLLETIPGIDSASAAAILVEAGPDPAATFGNAARFAAWAGVCPGNHESAGKRRNARAKAGAKHLRTVLVGCAHGATRTKGCQFHTYHRALTIRRGYKRAIVATAHKLARTVFALLRGGRPYRDPEVDYEALVVRRNAPRWLDKLDEFGYLEARPDGTMAVNWAPAGRHLATTTRRRATNRGRPHAGRRPPLPARFMPTTTHRMQWPHPCAQPPQRKANVSRQSQFR